MLRLPLRAEKTPVDLEVELDPPPADDTAAPWSGAHVRYGNFEELALRAMPKLVAVLGLQDTGKTSLLASLFLELANGQYGDLPYRFASSRTLLAFDQLALRANEGDVGHTPVESGSQFLHLGMRPLSERGLEPRHVDVLFSDIAGELTEQWSQNAAGEAAEALAFVRQSNAVLVLADVERLAPAGGREHDGKVADILRRVGTVLRDAPHRPDVLLVFTKIDRVPQLLEEGPCSTVPFNETAWKMPLRAGSIRAAMLALKRQGVEVGAFSLSSRPVARGVVGLFRHVLARVDRCTSLARPTWSIEPETSSLMTYTAARKEWE